MRRARLSSASIARDFLRTNRGAYERQSRLSPMLPAMVAAGAPRVAVDVTPRQRLSERLARASLSREDGGWTARVLSVLKYTPARASVSVPNMSAEMDIGVPFRVSRLSANRDSDALLVTLRSTLSGNVIRNRRVFVCLDYVQLRCCVANE